MLHLLRLAVVALAMLGLLPAIAQQTDELSALNTQVRKLYAEGKYAEAIPLALRAVTITEKKLGANHPDVAIGLNNLAELYRTQGHTGEAEVLYKRALSISEKALGPNHLNVASSLSNLALLYDAQGRYAEAEPLAKRSLSITEEALGPVHPTVANNLNNLAYVYHLQARFAEAEPLYKRSVAILEKALGPDHPAVAQNLVNLAALYYDEGRAAEAEPLFKRSLKILEKALGLEHPDLANSLNNLGALYFSQGRYVEAEPLYKRTIAILEKALGPDHPSVGTVLNNLGRVYEGQGHYDEAEPIYRRALAIREKALGPDHSDVGQTVNNLGALYFSQRRYAEAEPLMRRALAIREKALGQSHPDVAEAVNNLAEIYSAQGRYAEAEPLLNRAHTIWEKVVGPDHANVASSFYNLAALKFAQGDWNGAYDFFQRGTNLTVRRTRLGEERLGQALTSNSKSEAARERIAFSGFVKTAFRLVQVAPTRAPALSTAMFQVTQWAQSSMAGQSLAQMAARNAKGESTLGRLVRERQDLVIEWRGKDKLLTDAHSAPPDRRKPNFEAALETRLRTIDGRLLEIDALLKRDFPDYASLVNPESLSIEEIQAQLREDEALVLFLDTPEWKPSPQETFIWAVTKRDSRWVRTDLGTKALTEKVQGLRCGLDEEEWSGLSGAARCGALLGIGQPANTDPLPFHLGIAHELYQALFGQVEDLIDGKQLLIVPAGPLTSLPFHVLVTNKPETALPKNFEGYRGVAWLGRDHAMSVLPSVASLKALRENAKGSRGTKAYLGYGNPVLDGDGSCKEVKAPDKCPSLEVANLERPQVVSSGERAVRATVRGRSGRRSPDLSEMFAKGVAAEAVLANVRSLCPLPDTAYEIRCVAERLGVPASEIRLDASATEADIKALSASGALATYRVVHFATHGLLAGDVELLASRQGEPAIVLTPPKVPLDKDDDGLLTASEVAGLKLDADWVVLSACNTASADTLGAEALSGLARAFFYAGARALLVSHWPVYSDAAVRLTTQAFNEIDQSKDGRAVALQRALIALMDDTSQNDNAHPAVWAPFVLVGEGGRAANQ